jgi:hypothetical protein
MTHLRGVLLLLLLLLSACSWGGDASFSEPGGDADSLAFAERVGAFYGLLEGEPLDALVTFEDADLRAYFAEDQDFTDYYASLAQRVRESRFRHARADQVVVQEFRTEGANLAVVDIVLVGKHERALIFWDLELELTDVWRRQGGTWFLSPDKL